MDLSVIILTWNSERYIGSCLLSLISALKSTAFRYEILIVDNGSTDDTGSVIAKVSASEPGRVNLICLPTNVGTTKSRNIALAKASGRIICVMDSDVETSADTFNKLIPILEKCQDIGLAVPRISYPDGSWQKSWDRIPTILHKINRLFNLRKIERSDAELYRASTETVDVEYAISAFWLFHRDLLTSVGLLDERIFYAPEDVDYCMRIWKAGYRIVYVPTAHVIHHTQELSRGCRLNMAKLSHLKGLLYLFVKHGFIFKAPELRIAQKPVAGGAV